MLLKFLSSPKIVLFASYLQNNDKHKFNLFELFMFQNLLKKNWIFYFWKELIEKKRFILFKLEKKKGKRKIFKEKNNIIIFIIITIHHPLHSHQILAVGDTSISVCSSVLHPVEISNFVVIPSIRLIEN